MRRSEWIQVLLSAAVVVTLGGIVLVVSPPATTPPAEALLDVEPPSPDSPDLAEEDFLARRLLPGRDDLDLWEIYRAADRHIDAMPRYSSRLDVFLPSENELRAAPGLEAKNRELGTWRALGPGNIGGRTRALLIDPDHPNILYAGGVSGGVWKTNNSAARWRPLTDTLHNIAIGVLVFDPDDSRVIYAGTGEGVSSSTRYRGAGIFRSTDAGRTWRRLASTLNEDFRHVNDLVVSPLDTRRLYAATRSGVWRSLDAGETWAQTLDPDIRNGCLDLALFAGQQDDPLLASCGSFAQATVYKNPAAAAGDAWTSVLTEPGMARTSLAIAPSNPDIVYALAARYTAPPANDDDEGDPFQHALHAVFRSDNAGESGSWTATVRNDDPVKLNRLLLSSPVSGVRTDCFPDADLEDRFTGQAWYDNVIAVDPMNPEIVYTGGIDLFRSDDGGANWGVMSHWWNSPPSAHADHHRILFHPDYDGRGNRQMFVGNDGGIWLTHNARGATGRDVTSPCDPSDSRVVWQSLNNHYGVTQFYHGAPFPDGESYLGGTQDNGTLLGNDADGADDWVEILGGDGGFVAVDPENPRIYYLETQRLNLIKHVPRGSGFEYRSVIEGITEDDDDFLFIVPFTMDQRDSRTLWIGGRTLWRTRNGAALWEAASSKLSAEAKVSFIAVHPRNSNRVLAGMTDGTILRHNRALSTDATSAWQSSRIREDAFVAWIAFDPAELNVVYAVTSTLGGDHVYQSVDGGVTWQAVDGQGPRGLPNLPVNTIFVDPDRPRRLVVGTDRGVFVSTVGGREWAVENTGFARTHTYAISHLAHQDGRSLLFAFTHGRGAYRTQLR